MKVLIVEDEVRLAEALCQIFAQERHMAEAVHNGEDGLHYGLEGNYDVIVLDVMLPKLSGFEVARQLRAAGVKTPILMLTAKEDVKDKVRGLDDGADDYMTKPFAAEELLARIRALTRRPEDVQFETLRFANITLHVGNHTLRCGEKSVRLSFKEFEIMRILMAAKEAITPKETLLVKVWGSESSAEDNNVEAYISFLRKKLGYLAAGAEIETLRKVGYRLKERTV